MLEIFPAEHCKAFENKSWMNSWRNSWENLLEEIRSWRGTLRAIPAEPLEVIWSFCSWKNSGKTSFVNPGRTLCKKLETNSGRNCGRNAEWFSRHPKVCLESYGTTAIWWSLFIRQPKHKVTRGSLEIQQRIVLMHIGESWYTSGEHSAVGIEMCVWWPHN